jgi:hypothetical protein
MLAGLRRMLPSPDAEGLDGLRGFKPPCDFNARILTASIGCPVLVDTAFAVRSLSVKVSPSSPESRNKI